MKTAPFEIRTTTVNVDGVKIHATVSLIAEPDAFEYSNIEFGSEHENDAYAARFDSGELECVFIRVEVSALGIKGTDALGDCHIESKNAVQQIGEIIKEHGMIENATNELIDMLRTSRVALTK